MNEQEPNHFTAPRPTTPPPRALHPPVLTPSQSSNRPLPPRQAIVPSPQKPAFGPILIAIALLSLCLSLISLSVVIYTTFIEEDEPATPISYIDNNSRVFQENSIEEVADHVSPSVVSILVASKSGFFGTTNQGAGTGVIVDPSGYVLTNKHVIENASSLSIATDAGDIYDDIEIIGTDPLNDIAFLKIRGVSDLPAATLGDSKSLSIGQSVIAIGNALGQYQNTVTSGIISGIGRRIVAASSGGNSATENLSDLIQTDTAINPGNSGGPLVNAAGEVIGINTAIASESQGIGFAIPIGAVKGMLQGVLDKGILERPYIGITYLGITPEVVKTYDLPVKSGAYVQNDNSNAVIPNGPADKAGIKSGDIITKVNNTAIGAKGSISTLTAEYPVGTDITLTIVRDGIELAIPLTLGVYQ